MTPDYYEICPSCGSFVTYLFPFSGWCFNCTWPLIDTETATHVGICESCGEQVDGLYRKKCRKCRDSDWLLDHADEIDRCLANGLSVWKARQILRRHVQANGQKCLSCGGPMHKATKGVGYFCMKPKCRSAQNRLKRLIYEKGFDRTIALQTVLDEIAQRT